MADASKVLVVHQRADVAKRIGAAIASAGSDQFAGVEVSSVSSLAEALTELEHCAPTVIFTGLSLPDAEGFDGVRAIRKQCENSPLIALVKENDHGSGARAMESGAQDYLNESESRPNVVERAMVRALGRRRVEEEHEDTGRRTGIGQTAMGLMHEINNPLAALMLNVEMLKEGVHDDADDLVKDIEIAAKRIAAVVRRLETLRTPRRVPAIGGQEMVDLSGDKSNPPADARGKGGGGTAAPTSGKTILLVDDEESVRAIVTKILSREGHNVLEAEHGADAVRLAAGYSGKIDLLISDMYMPGLRGPEIVEKLRPTRPGIPVLFMSGYGDEDVARSGVQPGSAFLRKPFTVQELSEAVRAALEDSRRQ